MRERLNFYRLGERQVKCKDRDRCSLWSEQENAGTSARVSEHLGMEKDWDGRGEGARNGARK
jgi:hypothetical protein